MKGWLIATKAAFDIFFTYSKPLLVGSTHVLAQLILFLLKFLDHTRKELVHVFLCYSGCKVEHIEYVGVLVLLEWSRAHWSHLEQTQNALWELTCVEGDLVAAMALTEQVELLW